MTKAKAKDSNANASGSISVNYLRLSAGASVSVQISERLGRVAANKAAQNMRIVKAELAGVELAQFDGGTIVAEGVTVFAYPVQGGVAEFQMVAGQHNIENGAGHYPMATFDIVAATDCVICDIGPVANPLAVVTGPASAPDGALFIHYVVGKRSGQTIESVNGETFFVDAGEVAVVGLSID